MTQESLQSHRLAHIAYKLLEQYDTWLASWKPGGISAFTCSRGCTSCCDLSVGVSWAEACLLAQVLLKDSDGELADWVRRVRSLSDRCASQEEFFQAYRNRIGSCRLLGKEGECSTYPQRPLACRMLLTELPRRYCDRDYLLSATEMEHAFLLRRQDEVNCTGPWLAEPLEEAYRVEALLHSAAKRIFGCSLHGSLPILLDLALRGIAPEHMARESPKSPAYLVQEIS